MVEGLELAGVSVHYGATHAVDDVSLAVPLGSTLALVGPSGSGKSSLLRAIAGLEPLASGAVRFNGQDLSGVPEHKRHFGIVFQDAQLFPTFDVAGNIAYGLAGRSAAERRQRVEEMLALVDLEGFAKRRISELSGGQAQRVALARSLAPSPRALLLDEPFSALDRGLRERLAEDTARILHELGITAVHVTHDQEEAFTIADAVAVLDEGRLLQHASPQEMWARPGSHAVARFLGIRTFVSAETARSLGWSGELPERHVLGIGPRSLVLDPHGLPVRVVDERFAPDYVEVRVELPDSQRATLATQEPVEAERVAVRLTGGAVVPKSPDPIP